MPFWLVRTHFDTKPGTKFQEFGATQKKYVSLTPLWNTELIANHQTKFDDIFTQLGMLLDSMRANVTCRNLFRQFIIPFM